MAQSGWKRTQLQQHAMGDDIFVGSRSLAWTLCQIIIVTVCLKEKGARAETLPGL